MEDYLLYKIEQGQMKHFYMKLTDYTFNKFSINCTDD